jgi:membrane-bound ClpP family serine protease
VDVVSEGEMVEAGQPIEVIRVDGNRIVVRQTNVSKAE